MHSDYFIRDILFVGFMSTSGAQSVAIEHSPRMVTVLPSDADVRQVVCSKRATACLLSNHEVWVLTNFIAVKLS